MTHLIGEYDCRLDAKGRFLLPAALRKQLKPEDQDNFVLNRGFEGCLVLYPASEWEKQTKHMSKLNLYVAKNRQFYRQFHNGATAINPDSLGRVLIPKNLKAFAKITKDLVVFAYAGRIELWSKAAYDKAISESSENFASLAEDVMGTLKQDDEPSN